MDQFAQALATGLLTGCIYALLGAGFSLIWGVARVINLTHAAFAVLGAYSAYWVSLRQGLDPLISLAFIVPAGFIAGLAYHALVVRPAARRAHDLTLVSMVLTFGLASAGENAMALAWGPGPRALNTPYTGQSAVLGPVTLPLTHLYGALVAVAVIVGLSVFLTRTLAGKSVRAVWQDRDGAALCGIDLERVTGIAYGLATASAAAAGVAMSLVYTFSPASQLEWLVYVFLVVIVGGVGSLLGAVVAGIIVGSTAGLAILVIPFAWTPTVLFVALILLLLWRPSGLFRR